ncbi:MAG TPA: hypothetical protein VFQ53_19710 [Kofleriaceae bacterium]|nr:hypothetical protein [Kofleriaceae bacterium]
MEAVIDVADVVRKETKSGNTRFVIRSVDGRELVTFRPAIGERAEDFKGRRARIEFHEEQRGNFTNVYLDVIEPVPDEASGEPATGDQVDAVAWQVAPEAAPQIVGDGPHAPDEVFDALKPFKDRVAADIRGEPAPAAPEDDLSKHRAARRANDRGSR